MNKLSPLELRKLNEDIRKYYTTEGPFYLAKLYPRLDRAYILKRANKLGFRLRPELRTIVYQENAVKSSTTLKSKKDDSYSPKSPIGLSDEIQILACSKPWGWKPKKTRSKKV
jgi:hypothetical protein